MERSIKVITVIKRDRFHPRGDLREEERDVVLMWTPRISYSTHTPAMPTSNRILFLLDAIILVSEVIRIFMRGRRGVMHDASSLSLSPTSRVSSTSMPSFQLVKILASLRSSNYLTNVSFGFPSLLLSVVTFRLLGTLRNFATRVIVWKLTSRVRIFENILTFGTDIISRCVE